MFNDINILVAEENFANVLSVALPPVSQKYVGNGLKITWLN